MDLKNIKATAQLCTASKFKSTVQQSGIVKPLAASKSISEVSKPLATHFQAGLNSEAAVIFLLKQRQWHLIFQRLRTRIGEIDLVFCKDRRVLLIEVKKLSHAWRTFERIDKAQLKRLQKNRILFSGLFTSFEIQSYICWVDPQNRISFVTIE